ncbi:unnamed protein product, partial [Arabidopsis halleri]
MFSKEICLLSLTKEGRLSRVKGPVTVLRQPPRILMNDLGNISKKKIIPD